MSSPLSILNQHHADANPSLAPPTSSAEGPHFTGKLLWEKIARATSTVSHTFRPGDEDDDEKLDSEGQTQLTRILKKWVTCLLFPNPSASLNQTIHLNGPLDTTYQKLPPHRTFRVGCFPIWNDALALAQRNFRRRDGTQRRTLTLKDRIERMKNLRADLEPGCTGEGSLWRRVAVAVAGRGKRARGSS